MVNYQNLYNNYHHHHHKLEEFSRNFRRKIMKQEQKLIKRTKFKLLNFICFSFISCSLIWLFLTQIFGNPLHVTVSCNFVNETPEADNFLHEQESQNPPISSIDYNGTIHCDRSHFRTDICYMKGDIRTHSSSSSLFLYTSKLQDNNSEDQELQHEVIRPYTRKWERSVMNTIDQIHLISKPKPLKPHHYDCDVIHDVPAIFFSTGGYTGNVYHEFNDGLIPLYITSRHFNKKVIFVILEYHNWWYMKYGKVLSQLSDYPPIDFKADPRTHCFKEAIVGLKIHNELTIDSSIMPQNETILDMRGLLGRAFEPNPPKTNHVHKNKPKLVILSRSGPRSIRNENSLVRLAQKIGFNVQLLKPTRDTQLESIYKVISNSDVMIGVHGAAMTHFLFLKPGCMVIQVVPIGTDWAAETYYGDPAKKFGLNYIEYKVRPRESSLYYKYGENDPILRDPNSVNKKGWEYTKKIYLDDQYLTLNLKRFKKILVRSYADYMVRSGRSR